MTQDNKALAEVRHSFMIYRNGAVADTLRQAGWPHRLIYGLNVPQLKEIAAALQDGAPALAETLWRDRDCRESRLLACHLLPHSLNTSEALGLCRDLLTREEADMLAFRCLRHNPDAAAIEAALSADDSPMMQYAAEALRRFLQ